MQHAERGQMLYLQRDENDTRTSCILCKRQACICVTLRRLRNGNVEATPLCEAGLRNYIMSTVRRSLSAFLLSGILTLANRPNLNHARRFSKRNPLTYTYTCVSNYADTITNLHAGILPCVYEGGDWLAYAVVKAQFLTYIHRDKG